MPMTALPLRSLPFLLATLAASAGPQPGHVVPFRQVDLCAQASSPIVEMKVKEGEAVKAGQPLAQLYGRQEELAMQRAKALLERREYEARGTKKLFENKVIPENQNLEARIELELARIQFDAAAEALKLRTLNSPIDGLVTERYRDLGETVAAHQPVFRIVDLSKVFVLCDLKPEVAAKVSKGAKLPVRIPQLEGAPSFEGEVVFVGCQADAAGLFRVKLVVDNPGLRILAGLKALVELP
jgi:membrane fusion protein, multidrug efflux system